MLTLYLGLSGCLMTTFSRYHPAPIPLPSWPISIFFIFSKVTASISNTSHWKKNPQKSYNSYIAKKYYLGIDLGTKTKLEWINRLMNSWIQNRLIAVVSHSPHLSFFELVDVGGWISQVTSACVSQLSKYTQKHICICSSTRFLPCVNLNCVFHHWKKNISSSFSLKDHGIILLP